MWKEIWKNRVEIIKEKKLAEFNYKILHNILTCGEHLFKWKILQTNLCRFGCDQVENYEHMFISCKRLKILNKILKQTFQRLGFNININLKQIIIGHKIQYEAYNELNEIINSIYYAVYKHWLSNSTLPVESFVIFALESKLQIEQVSKNTKRSKLLEKCIQNLKLTLSTSESL